ncbi:META domain-containing protein [Mangrovimonas spongiae]|uniref:META domain-containing protein n=1 Tax=Mangrovimonas spongiae TaxID=2494697 RepID=A0A3R9MAS2_9FLAO|nr:META domain-containing protein [Mangrovimonas spongiae]RSK41348.1 META domain-containing protein [Mangrovimonas spongiae]
MKRITLLLGISLILLSCGNKKKHKEDTTTTNTTLADSTSQITTPVAKQKLAPDMYFKAQGTEPFWQITLSDKMIKLNILEDSIITPHTTPVKAQDANVKRYNLHTELAEMTITISYKECINAMSGLSSPYSVTVDYKKGADSTFTKLNGCGTYITDYRLHDIWVLETLHNETVTTTDFKKKLPSIEINTTTNTFSGYAGCNTMRGALFYEKNLLRFTDIITTKMMCANNKENDVIKALKSATNYSIKNNRLHLFNPNEELLVFKKID